MAYKCLAGAALTTLLLVGSCGADDSHRRAQDADAGASGEGERGGEAGGEPSLPVGEQAGAGGQPVSELGGAAGELSAGIAGELSAGIAGAQAGASGADTGACAPVCIGDATDDFAGGSLAPHWLAGTTACGSTTATSGAVVLSRPADCSANPAAVLDTCAYKICGDFDVQVDFTLLDFTIPAAGGHYVGLNVQQPGGWSATIERYNTTAVTAQVPQQENYKAYINSSLDADANFAPGTDATGSFRITRVGTTLSAYYWSGGAWSLLATGVGTTNDDVLIGLYEGSDMPSTLSAQFDNFVIQSGVP
jgi:hypothetical protein